MGWRWLGVLLAAGALCSCQTAHVAQPLTQSQDTGGSDPDSQMEFWHQLAARPVTCNDEAFHAVLLYVDEKDDSANYAQRVETLRERGLLPSSFAGTADEAIRRGTLAVTIVKILHIKGGWVMHVFGPTQRYAVRELIYDGLYPPSSPQQTFSGTEFLGIMGKVEDYRREHFAELPETENNPGTSGATTQEAAPAPFGHGEATRPIH
jgi:hypothetical protein